MKKLNKKGFTLAELLVVVAIIAVLAAISIPVFTSRVESSREATDIANIRTAYAELTTSILTGEEDEDATKEVTLKQTKGGWTGDNADAEIGGTAIYVENDATKGIKDFPTSGNIPNGAKVKVSVDSTGKAVMEYKEA